VWKLRLSIIASAVGMGLVSVSLPVAAEVRQVGGTKAVWDKACMKSSSCLPVGDLGNGVNGYSVVNPDGSETSVYCNDQRCVGEEGPAPAREVPKPSKPLLDALAGKVGSATSQQTKATKPDPLVVIQAQ
jgi:hypothetical protein